MVPANFGEGPLKGLGCHEKMAAGSGHSNLGVMKKIGSVIDGSQKMQTIKKQKQQQLEKIFKSNFRKSRLSKYRKSKIPPARWAWVV